VLFEGEGSKAKIFGIIYGKNKQLVDLTTNAFHKARATSCDILVKCVLDDASSSIYRGKIKIEKKAQQTNSYLADHTLVLSENASSNSIPSLEIDANDVRASHAATQGKPDEEEIFYLMTRGLSKIVSEKLIISGFFSEILEQIKDNNIKKDFEKTCEVK
jgi:Fe-S cluster assembly protein SufD